MPKIPTTLEFHAKPKEHLWDMMRKLWEQLAIIVNGGLSIGNAFNMTANNVANPLNVDNLKGAMVFCTFNATPNTDTIITHNLGYKPRCYFPVVKLVSCDIFDGGVSGSPTTSTITLRSNVANANVVLFIF